MVISEIRVLYWPYEKSYLYVSKLPCYKLAME